MSPMTSWDLWDVVGHLWDTLNYYGVRLFFICPMSPMKFTVKGMKSMYVCMYEYIVTYIHSYILFMPFTVNLMELMEHL